MKSALCLLPFLPSRANFNVIISGSNAPKKQRTVVFQVNYNALEDEIRYFVFYGKYKVNVYLPCSALFDYL